MASFHQRLPFLASVEILSVLPASSLRNVRSTSKTVRAMMESTVFQEAVRLRPKELVVVRAGTGKKMVQQARNLINAFMTPSCPMQSVRLELEKLEEGDKKSMSFESPYYKFLQLREGGEQAHAVPFEHDLQLNGPLVPSSLLEGPCRDPSSVVHGLWWV